MGMLNSVRAKITPIFITIVIVTSFPFACEASERIVYDGIVDVGGGSGFNNLFEVGQSISLEGTERAVTKFEVFISARGETFQVKFYSPNGPGGEPGTLLWISPPISPQIMDYYSIPVPNIVVPRTFIWTVRPVVVPDSPSSINVSFGSNTFTGPIVGNSNERWLLLNNDTWFPVEDGNIFAVRITATGPDAIEVSIDIKPGSYPNCVNINGHGVIPVAILGDNNLYVDDIKIDDTLVFNGVGVRVRGKKGPLCSIENINGDEFLDLVCQFEDDPSQWIEGNDNATLITELLDGTPIMGTDSICVVP